MKKIMSMVITLFIALFCAQPAFASCQKCCAEGRFVDDECLGGCNQCQQYDDSASAEGRDHPY
jgi:hypothetical protein